MSLVKIKDGQWNVVTKDNTFGINEADDHTAAMLAEFQKNPEALAAFEAELDNDPLNAYNVYHGIPVEIKKEEADHLKAEADKFAALVEAGDFKGAFYALQGLEKPADVTIEPKSK